MNENEKTSLDWQACHEGDIGKVSCFLKRRRRLHQCKKCGVAMLLVLAGLSTGWFAFFADQDPQKVPAGRKLAGLYCSEVMAFSEQLFNGELDARLISKIRGHVNRCTWCIEHLGKKKVEFEKRTGKKAKFSPGREPEVVRKTPKRQSLVLVGLQ